MPDPDTLRALVSGLIAGAAAAFASTAIVLVALARGRWWTRLPERQRVPLPLLGVVFVNGLMLAWTLLGLVLGAGYPRAAAVTPGAGLGSPNVRFTLLVAGVIIVALALAGFVRRRVTWPMWWTAGVALAAFGWLLPLLAG
jgi:hypothetical protein